MQRLRSLYSILSTPESDRNRFRRTLDALGLCDILDGRLASRERNIRGKPVPENIVILMGRCACCMREVPVPYDRQITTDKTYTYKMLGLYPVHKGECEYFFEILKKRRGGIAH